MTRTPRPGGWDLRVGAEADALLAHAGVNGSAEVGVFSFGFGALSAGVEAAALHCILSCGSGGGVQVSRWVASPMGRLGWHYVVGGESPNAAEIDLYAVALGGVAFAVQDARATGATLSSTALAPIFGAGLGSMYFPGEGAGVFAAGELRVLYAVQTARAEGSGLTLTPWSIGGIRLMFSMGVRL